MKKGDKVAFACCSNPLSDDSKPFVLQLKKELEQMGLQVEMSNRLFVSDHAEAKERAKALMKFYEDSEIKAIFDLSGGDMANEILSYLDFEVIKNSTKKYFGYSDLTTIINAIYQKTKQPSVLYQVRNLLPQSSDKNSFSVAKIQRKHFKESLCSDSEEVFLRKPLGQFHYHFIQGEEMEGTIVGGNIRCFLKLAGTPFFPDVTDKILFLEARSGGKPQMIIYISQLNQMGVFEKVKGIMLGTFTYLDANESVDSIEKLLLRQIDGELPVARTLEIGHGGDSKALEIGGYYKFCSVQNRGRGL